MAVVARTTTLSQADIVQAVLSSHDIPSYILNENTSATLPHLFLAINHAGLQIVVRQCDWEQARMILEDRSQRIEVTEIEKKQPDVQESCKKKYAKKAYYSFWFGCLNSLFFILVPYYFFRALFSNDELTKRDRKQYYKYMTFISILICILIVIVWFCFLLWYR
ncbi:MAG: DUF2007 domain-containing protein [Phycisphaerae bacterium]|nr:DUF2007 domain-containing protein [Phycisphaerae bacterium]